jgi:PAS domain S-box-containing protein
MRRPLRALIVEDSENDAFLVLRALDRGGYDVTHQRVETAEAMREALKSASWDIILSDFSVPGFGAVPALAVRKESGVDIPFVILSGSIGEESAVAVLKAGADDFLLKNQLARFVPAVDRELREAESRRERRRAEQALRESERKYRRIVETAQEGIWMIDQSDCTTYVNRRMAEMLGAAPDALVGASITEFMVDEWKERIAQTLQRKRQGLPDQHDLRIRRRDGSEFWASLSMNPMLEEDGRYVGSLAMMTDVTEPRKLQEQLMVSDRMASIGTLAAGVAHEINNPLSAVLGNLQLATQSMEDFCERGCEPGEMGELNEALLDALEAAERVRHIVRDLKLFSRAQDEKRGPVDVQRVLESTIRMAWPEIRHRAKLIKDYKPLPPVLANESRLGQVCLNLLVNAAQAIEEGHAENNEIHVCSFVDGSGRVVVEIRDTGGGMPADVLRRLFTPFFTTKSVGVGTGLGLSICHRIITALGGEIAVESTVGKGSVFRLILPPAPPTEPEEPELIAVSAPAKRRGHILVVDDEPMILNIVRRVLATEHDLDTVTSAEEAIARIGAGVRFDIIICDLMMPHVTGMDLYAEILRADPEQARRMIFLTGGAFTPRARAFLDEIENPRIEKPFDHSALKSLINDQLQ